MSTRFRFSLATLVLAVIWAGAGMWVWAWRDPWRYDQTVSRIDFGKFVPQRWNEYDHFETSDGVRRYSVYRNKAQVTKIAIYDTRSALKLFQFREFGIPAGFVDDDNFAFRFGPWDKIVSSNDKYEIFHRHFPEWWWGDFYRPEVWLFVGLSAALFWRFLRWRRNSLKVATS